MEERIPDPVVAVSLPMSILRKEIRQISKLAGLQFSDVEEKVLTQDVSRILDYVSILNQVDTSGIEPLTHVHDLANAVRANFV